MEFKWYWVIPITLAIVGFFGIFWTTNLSDARIEIDLKMDNNSLEAIQIINSTQYGEPVPLDNINSIADIKQDVDCDTRGEIARINDCIKGCSIMHYALVGQNGKEEQDGFYIKDCVGFCQDELNLNILSEY